MSQPVISPSCKTYVQKQKTRLIDKARQLASTLSGADTLYLQVQAPSHEKGPDFAEWNLQGIVLKSRSL